MKDKLSRNLREKVLRLAASTGTKYPHVGSSMSCIDLIIETQFFQMKKNDKFILSKGHASLSLYVVLNKKGKISDKQLSTYFKEGGLFGVHPPPTFPEDIPLATGSLGHGLSFACGIAKADQIIKNKARKIFCLISDGECNEGSVWEAALFASHHKLKNIIVIIDKNGFQGIDATSNVLGDAASQEKWKSFGFNVIQCDGHSYFHLEKAFKKISNFKNNQPSVLIAKTVRGKGLKSIEGKMESNYFTLNNENVEKYLKELE